MISGSYWPGDISLFRGVGGSRYAPGEILLRPDGEHVNAGPPWVQKRQPQMDSLAAAPRLQDVDGDGDLDLLVGNIAGHVMLLQNDGDRAHWAFAAAPLRVQAGGMDLAVQNDAGPTTADWDGDGLWDLIVGAGDGSVRFYKNTGTGKAMQFAAGVVLIEPGRYDIAHDRAPQRSFSRAKPHVCDWNGDGLPDLLVGDFASIDMPEPVLTEAQTKERDALRKERNDVSAKMSECFAKLEGKELEGADKAEYEEWNARYQETSKKLRPLEKEHKTAGWVWVYLQKPPSKPQ